MQLVPQVGGRRSRCCPGAEAFDVSQSEQWESRVIKAPDRQERQARDAQVDCHLDDDVDRRARRLGFLADGKARYRTFRRQRLRDDLGMASSGLCEQSVLARSLELERSTSGASKMLPGIADRFRAAGESANAAVKARDTSLDALADGLTWLPGSGVLVDSRASDGVRIG
jgi:hypothetical protein